MCLFETQARSACSQQLIVNKNRGRRNQIRDVYKKKKRQEKRTKTRKLSMKGALARARLFTSCLAWRSREEKKGIKYMQMAWRFVYGALRVMSVYDLVTGTGVS